MTRRRVDELDKFDSESELEQQHEAEEESTDAEEDDKQDDKKVPDSSCQRKRAAASLQRLGDQKWDVVKDSIPQTNYNCKQEIFHGLLRESWKWRFLLRRGFSMLFYGFGSKRSLLQTFAKETLLDGGCIVWDGYSPQVSARGIIQTVAKTLSNKNVRSGQPQECIEAIRAEGPDRYMYVVIHNIDGPNLRDKADQALLGELAALPNIHLAASVDHVNAPLLWDQATYIQFNWVWKKASTYQTYDSEISNRLRITNGIRQTATQKSAETVLRSMVRNAREVFRVLAEHQLEDPEAGGASFTHLFRMCRERFLVSSEAALRAHLTEYVDHELVKLRQQADGSDLLLIPLDEDALKAAVQVLSELEA